MSHCETMFISDPTRRAPFRLDFDPVSCRLRALRQRDPYSITSSARASRVGGTARPSALAVRRLTIRTAILAMSTCDQPIGGNTSLVFALDAGFDPSSGDPRDISALRRHHRLCLFDRRLWDDGAQLRQHSYRADPLRPWFAARRQYRLPQIHAADDLESVLAGPP